MEAKELLCQRTYQIMLYFPKEIFLGEEMRGRLFVLVRLLLLHF